MSVRDFNPSLPGYVSAYGADVWHIPSEALPDGYKGLCGIRVRGPAFFTLRRGPSDPPSMCQTCVRLRGDDLE